MVDIRWWRQIIRRRADREADLAREIKAHLDKEAEEQRAGGVPTEEARLAALRLFGNVAAVEEDVREAWGWRRLDRFYQDVRYAARDLRHNPGFALVIVISLGLGIGANSALFSVIDAVLMRPLPVAHPEQLYQVDLSESRFRAPQRFSYPAFERMRDVAPNETASMSRIAHMHGRLDGESEQETDAVQLVSGEYFALLGISPALGRLLAPEDNVKIGEHPVAVISHDFWTRRFGASANALGRRLTLNGAHFTIVGVASAGFRGMWLESPTDVWIPLMMQAAAHYAQNFSEDDANADQPWPNQEGIRWLDLVVRTEVHAAALDTVFRQMLVRQAENIDDPENRRLFLQQRVILNPIGRGFSNLRGRFSRPLFALAGMVALVLLIACANTANLMLARGSSRQREIAVRLSIGASRPRLVRQLLTESFVLVAMAAAAGLLLAHIASQLLVRMALGIAQGPAPFSTGLDTRVLAFTTGLSVLTVLLFGLAPSVRATRVDLEAALRAGARGVYAGARITPQKLLVAAQIALTFVLVVAAAWFSSSLRYLARLNLGYDQEHVVTVWIDPQSAGYPQTQLPALDRRLVESMEALPGVRSAAVAMCGLASGCQWNSGVTIEGYRPAPGEQVSLQQNVVGLNYFATVGMRVLAGRDLTEHDDRTSGQVAIINEAAVRRYFPNGSALGRRIGWDKAGVEIVGIVNDARVNSARESAVPMAYYPLAQFTVYGGSLEVRVTGDPAARIRQIRQAVSSVDRNLPIERITTLRQQVDGNLRQDRLVTWLASLFGTLAMGLACLGIYGAMSYAVARRTGEIGIRMALGAQQWRLFRMVFIESLSLLALGLAAGVPLVLAATRPVSSVVLGVDPRDPRLIIAAGLAVTVAAALASYLPARRAALLDPVAALRSE
jgi:predicted permease